MFLKMPHAILMAGPGGSAITTHGLVLAATEKLRSESTHLYPLQFDILQSQSPVCRKIRFIGSQNSTQLQGSIRCDMQRPITFPMRCSYTRDTLAALSLRIETLFPNWSGMSWRVLLRSVWHVRR